MSNLCSLPTLQKIVGIEWIKWAQSLMDEFALQQLDMGLEALVGKIGMNSVKKAYRKRLLKEIMQAPPYTVKAVGITGEDLEIPESPKLEQFFFEVLCLAKLAELSDEVELLSPGKQPQPEAKVKIEGYDCLVEVKFFMDPMMHEEFASRPITDPRLSGQSAKSEQLPPYVHLRDKLSEAWRKFENARNTINLIFVCYFSLPEVGVTFIPALYGEKFLRAPFVPWEFVIPSESELGEGGLFAENNWRFVSGIAAVWAQRYPPIPPWQEIRWSGMLFDNPKASTPIPREISMKLSKGLNILPLKILHELLPSKFTREEMEELYDRYVRSLEQKFWGKLVAVSRKGEILLGDDDEVELTRKAIERFGKWNFVIFRIGPKAVVRI